jgi:hypothetical protein
VRGWAGVEGEGIVHFVRWNFEAEIASEPQILGPESRDSNVEIKKPRPERKGV